MQADWKLTDQFLILGGIRRDRIGDYSIDAYGGYPEEVRNTRERYLHKCSDCKYKHSEIGA